MAGFIAPTDSTDTYATQDSVYGKGGHKEAADITARNAITSSRRREGMFVYVLDSDGAGTAGLFTLSGGITNSDWQEVTLGGGGGGGITVQDIDGNPSLTNVSTIEFTNGTVAANGAGVARVSTLNLTNGSASRIPFCTNGNTFNAEADFSYNSGSNTLNVDNITVDTDLDVSNDLDVTNNATVGGALSVSSTASVSSTLSAVGVLVATPGSTVGSYGIGSRISRRGWGPDAPAVWSTPPGLGRLISGSSSGWARTNNTSEASVKGPIGVSVNVGTTAHILIEGVVTVAQNLATLSDYDVLYAGTNGGFATTPPSSGNYSRVVGFVQDASANKVYFSPSMDWVEVS